MYNFDLDPKGHHHGGLSGEGWTFYLSSKLASEEVAQRLRELVQDRVCPRSRFAQIYGTATMRAATSPVRPCIGRSPTRWAGNQVNIDPGC